VRSFAAPENAVSLFGKSPRDGDSPPAPQVGARPASAPRGNATAPISEPSFFRHLEPARIQRESMANIGKSITIKGDLTGDEDIQVEGTVEGRVDLPNNQFTIGPEGRVRAEIHAKLVVVIGQVTGNIIAAERLEVQATGTIHGDVKAPRLIVHEGAVINGSIEMGKAPTPAKVALAAG
jgi:cytoskeletal protein CcmA (bactofilin family)